MSSSENIPIQTGNSILFGNDIVDLNDVDSALPGSRSLLRLFTSAELRIIEKHGYDKKHIWSLWACKEAAFKAISGLFPETLFRWKKFEVMPDLLSVRYEDHDFFTQVKYGDDFLYAVAVGRMECYRSVKNRENKIINIICETNEMNQMLLKYAHLHLDRDGDRKSADEIPSAADILKEKEYLSMEDIIHNQGDDSAKVRFLGMNEIEKRYNIPAGEMLVTGVKSKPLAPRFYGKNGEFITSASFSHHGKFYAVSFPAIE